MRLTSLAAALFLLCAALLHVSAVQAEDDKPWFSGKTTVYTDTFNGYKIAIPEELKQTSKGESSSWVAQPDGSIAVGVHVNATRMPGVPAIAMYEAILKSKKQDRDVKDVVALPVSKFNKKLVYAFRYSEADHKNGMPDKKEPTDIHRCHMYVFGNEFQYNIQCDSRYSAFQNKKVQAAFDKVFKSFALVGVK